MSSAVCHRSVLWETFGKRTFLKPVNGHGIVDGVGGRDPGFVAAIVFMCGANVVAFVYTIGGKITALRRGFKDNDFGAGDS